MKEPPQPPPEPAEELLKEYPELQAFGVEWVKKWLDLRERLVEIAKTLRKFPWMVYVIRQRPMSVHTPTRWRCMLQRTALRLASL